MYKFHYLKCLVMILKDTLGRCRLPQLSDGHRTASRFFTPVNASSYDSVVRIATFGNDYLWKRNILEIIEKHESTSLSPYSSSSLPSSSQRSYTYLDLACGTGILSSSLKCRHGRLVQRTGGVRPEEEIAGTNKNVIGLDLTFDYLKIANKKGRSMGGELMLTNGTAELLPYRDESFECVMSSYLAKYINVTKVVRECGRVLRHGGLLLFHDFTYPSNLLIRTFWNAYFHVLRVAAKTMKSWASVFRELDQLVKTSSWVPKTIKALEENDFEKINLRVCSMGTATIIWASKP